jgi:hypothetical protein
MKMNVSDKKDLIKTVWDWITEINSKKTNPNHFTSSDWDKFNAYTIHRVMSMNPNFLEIVNEIQIIPYSNKKQIYEIYREFIPINNKWNKYIKSSIKESNKELIEYLKIYFEVSSKEIKEYLNFLDKNEIFSILESFGLNKKEIKKIT